MSRPEFPVFDGHNDSLLALHPKAGESRSFFVESDRGHIDLPRAERGGFAGGFFAIFVPPIAVEPPDEVATTGAPPDAPALDPAYARSLTEDDIARLFLLEEEGAGRFEVVRTAEDLDRCLADGIMAAILHFEGAEAIHPDLDALEEFYEIGLRSLGIVWSRPNVYGEGVPFLFPGTPTSAGASRLAAWNWSQRATGSAFWLICLISTSAVSGIRRSAPQRPSSPRTPRSTPFPHPAGT